MLRLFPTLLCKPSESACGSVVRFSEKFILRKSASESILSQRMVDKSCIQRIEAVRQDLGAAQLGDRGRVIFRGPAVERGGLKHIADCLIDLGRRDAMFARVDAQRRFIVQQMHPRVAFEACHVVAVGRMP